MYFSVTSRKLQFYFTLLYSFHKFKPISLVNLAAINYLIETSNTRTENKAN